MDNRKSAPAASHPGFTSTLLNFFGFKRKYTDTNYNQEFITSSVVQLLEFVQLIETSTEPNTVLRAYKLLTSRRKPVMAAKDHPFFAEDFRKGCDLFQQFYDNGADASIRVLESSEAETEQYFFQHYKRCWLDYVSQQNTLIKQSPGRNSREVRRNVLWEKFRMISDDAEWEVNDFTAFYSLKAELSGAIKRTISWPKTDFASN